MHDIHLKKKNRQAGFTLVELVVTMALMVMVIGLAGIFFNFSFQSERKVEDEFTLQANMRIASETINNTVRNATVAFTMPQNKFNDPKKDKWSYFGLKDGTKVMQYIWNPATGHHDEKVILQAAAGYHYNLYFTQATSGSKLLKFHLECIPDDNEAKAIAVDTELSALNSVAVDNGGTEENLAVAIAYRNDAAPTPEVQSTTTEVSIAVALVLDDSGSMADDMEGDPEYISGFFGYYKNPDFNSSAVRTKILKTEAKKLVDKFISYKNVKMCIIPYSDNANAASGMMNCDSAHEAQLKTVIDGLKASGGTNIGDALRRAYYSLYNYKTAHSSATMVYYIILLTDGDPTYYSTTDGYTFQQEDGNCISVSGNGRNDSSGNCLSYCQTIGQNKIVGTSIDIKTFLIGFTAVSSEVSKAKSIAETYCTKSGNAARTGKYYTAGSQIELEKVFNTIQKTILQETWHIYGPY